MDDNAVVTQPGTVQAVVTPIKGSPEHNALMASMAPANVPDKFKNTDGTVNLSALTQAYRELETKQSQSKVEPPKADPNPAEGIDPGLIEAALTGKVTATGATGWQTAQAEIEADGDISPTTRESLKAKYGADDSVLDGMVTGHKAKLAVHTQKLAESVGGVEALKGALQFAARTMPEAELNQLRVALKGPMGPMVLRGLAASMGTQTATAVTPAKNPGASMGVVASTGGKAMFTSIGEMMAEMRSPAYRNGNDEYRLQVAARIPVGFGR